MNDRTLNAPSAKQLAAASDALALGDYLLFADQPGLRLVAGKLARTWIHRYRQPGGDIVQLKLGRYPSISHAEAVAAYEENNRRRERGDDPAVERDRSREQRVRDESAARARAYTVERMVEDYLAEHVEANRTPKSAAEVRRIFEKNVIPKFGSRSVADVSRADAVAFLASLALRTSSTARVARLEMRAAHDHAVSHGRVDDGVVNAWDAAGRDRSLRSKLKAGRRSRYLTDSELATLLKWLPGSKLSRTVREALHLTLLTGMRSGEVVAGRWADIDLAAGTWSLPKTKTDAPRTVRLPRQAVAILSQRRGLHGEFVFASPTDGHVGQNSLVWAVVRHRDTSGLADWSAHDLRRSMRTGLSRIGCPTEVAEAAIGHTKAGVVGVYDLHKYEAEVGQWLQRWADHLDALESPVVVPLRVAT